MTFRNCVAVDLGASSGRVMLARYQRECRSLTLREIHRFKNGLHSQNGYVTRNVDSPGKCHSPWIKQGVRGRDSYR